jgi:hypothetical protein
MKSFVCKREASFVHDNQSKSQGESNPLCPSFNEYDANCYQHSFCGMRFETWGKLRETPSSPIYKNIKTNIAIKIVIKIDRNMKP